MPMPRVLAAVTFAFVAAAAASACTSSEPAHPEMVTPHDVSFAEDVEAIVQNRCQSCHHDGGIAPFALVSYDDVRSHGALVRQKVVAREMPPWGAFDQPDCKMEHKLKDDLRLSDAEIATIDTWVTNGMPLGDVTKRPPLRTFATEGLAGKTHTLKMDHPHLVAGAGTDEIRCFSIDPGFAQDTWVAGTNVVPGEPSVVHHAIVYIDPNAESPALVAADPAHDGSYACFGGPNLKATPSVLLAWAPGVRPNDLGDDTGIKVPKGARLVLQVHYHPHTDTTSVTDDTTFELKALPTKPSFIAQVILAGNATSSDPKKIIHLVPPSGNSFLVPANATNHVEAMEVNIPDKIGNVSLPPTGILIAGAHMHWAGVNMKIEITRKTGSPGQPEHECLLSTPKYDFNWQRGYVIDEDFDALPLVSPGDTVRFTCTYDNSLGNKYVARSLAEDHEAAPHDIHLGETTRDEMCLGAIVGVRRASAIDF